MFKQSFIFFALALATPAFAQTTALTYQGELKAAGQLASGAHDMQFKLFDALIGGVQIGPTVCLDNVNVVAGRFTAQLDFGQAYNSSSGRFLEIQVRADAGLDCSSAAGFTPLPARQPVNAAPFATRAKAAYALDAADGSPLNAVSVDNAGQVGINTGTPGAALTVAGNMELGTTSSDYRNFRIGGGNSSGYLYGSFPLFGDNIHLGYNYFADAAGASHIVRTDGQTSRMSLGYGSIVLATGGTNIALVNRSQIDQSGNVAVGTAAPLAKLDARGEVTFGANAQYRPIAQTESLRMVRGSIGGTASVLAGSGYHAEHPNDGVYSIWFEPPFSGTPTVTACVQDRGSTTLGTVYVTISTLDVNTAWFTVRSSDGFPSTEFIDFIAVGPK